MEPQVEVPAIQPTPEEETVTLSKAELEDLKHKAEVSSQNFERLKKEEEKRKDLEAQLAQLPTNTVPSDKSEILEVKGELAEITAKLAKSEVIESYPVLKGLWNEFETFRTADENKGMNLRTSARAFLSEKGLLEPSRKGNERPTGGDKTPLSQGLSAEDAKALRENNPRQYYEMIKKDQLKVSH